MGPDLNWQSVGAWLLFVLQEFSDQIYAQVVSYGTRPSRCTGSRVRSGINLTHHGSKSQNDL